MALYSPLAGGDADWNDVPVYGDTMADLLAVVPTTLPAIALIFDTGIVYYNASMTETEDNETMWRPDSVAPGGGGRWMLFAPGGDMVISWINYAIQDVQDQIDALTPASPLDPSVPSMSITDANALFGA